MKPLLSALLLLAISSAATAATASSGSEFDVRVWTGSSVHVDGPTQSTLDEAWIVGRWQLSASNVSIEGTLRHASATRYEYTQAFVGDPRNDRSLRDPSPRITATPLVIGDARMQTAGWGRTPAIAVGMETASLADAASLSTPGEIVSPTIRDLNGAPGDFAGPYQPGERGHWRLSGDFLQLQLADTAIVGSGSLRLYIFDGILQIQNSTGNHTLTAEVRDDAVEPTASTFARHVVWYELEAGGSQVRAAIGRSTAGARFSAAARAFEIRDARAVSFDSARSVEGTVPESSIRNGSALWIRGSLDISATASQDGAEQSWYEVKVGGRPSAFSVGGGKPEALDYAVPSAGPVLLVVLASLFYFRDLVSSVGARLFLPLYTKLKKDHLLDVPARENIFRLIQATPGIHFLQIHKTLRTDRSSAVAYGQLAYHLSQMERFELIVSKREGRYRRYFDTNARLGADAARVALLQTTPVPLIAKALLESPGSTQMALHQRLSSNLPITRQALAYHLKRLVAKDLAVVANEGRFHHYQPTERLVRLAGFLTGAPAASTAPAEPAPAS